MNLDIYQYAIEATEELGELFSSLELKAAYADIANESSTYYSVANESVLETIGNIFKAIGAFIAKIFNAVREAISRAVNYIKGKLSRTKKTSSSKAYAIYYQSWVQANVNAEKNNPIQFVNDIEKNIESENLQIDNITETKKENEEFAKEIDELISNNDLYRKRVKQFQPKDVMEFESQDAAINYNKKSYDAIINEMNYLSKNANDWIEASKNIGKIKLKNYNSLSKSSELKDYIKDKVNKFKSYIQLAKSSAMAIAKALLNCAKLYQKDFNAITHVFNTREEAEAFLNSINNA